MEATTLQLDVNDYATPGQADAAREIDRQDEVSDAVEKFKREGYYIWQNLLDVDFIRELRPVYQAVLDRKMQEFSLRSAEMSDEWKNSPTRVLNDFTPKGGNHDVNRWTMHLPSKKPLFDERLYANPKILKAVESLMGSNDFVCYLVASITAYPGSTPQGAHQDFTRFSISLDIPLVDCTEQNAALEIWPGTHHPDAASGGFTTGANSIPAERMREIVAEVPSRRMLMKPGAVLMRDHRLVHRGTANVSDAPREMLSVYFVRPRPVPYRWVADVGVRMALFLRRWGRGRGDEVQRPNVYNLGSVLGRVVEEYSLTDRDYRRRIPREIWQELSSRSKELLRYASVENAHDGHKPRGTFQGTWLFIKGWVKSVNGFVYSAVTGTPRKPDEEEH